MADIQPMTDEHDPLQCTCFDCLHNAGYGLQQRDSEASESAGERMNEPMTDRQLYVLAKEIRMAFATHAQGPVAAAVQRTADKDVAYLIEEYQDLRAALEQEQREHGNCEGVNAQRFQTLTDTIIALTQQVTAMQQVDGAAIDELAFQRDINQQLGDENEQLRAQIAAMRPMVEAVAEAAVGDEYGGGSWLMFAGYRAETIREQARAYLAKHPAGEAS